MTREQFENYLDFIASKHPGMVKHLGQMGRFARGGRHDCDLLIWDHVAQDVLYNIVGITKGYGFEALLQWEEANYLCRRDREEKNFSEQMGLQLLLESST